MLKKQQTRDKLADQLDKLALGAAFAAGVGLFVEAKMTVINAVILLAFSVCLTLASVLLREQGEEEGVVNKEKKDHE